MYRISTVMLVLSLALPAAAADKFDAEARARTIAPFVDEQTVIVAHVDLTRIDADALSDWAVENGGLEKKEIEEFRRGLRGLLSAFALAGGKEIYVIFSLSDVPPGPPLVVVPLASGAKAVRAVLDRVLDFKHSPFETFTVDQAFIAGSTEARKRIQSGKPAARPELAKAFAAAGDTTAQLLLLPTADTRRVLSELLPALPPQLGGGSTRPLTHGLLWAAAGVDLPPKPSLRLRIQSPNADSAGALRDLLPRLLKSVVEQREVRDFLPGIGRLPEAFDLQVEENQLKLSTKEKELKELLPTLVRRTYQTAQNRATENRLKQQVLAMLNYADANKSQMSAVANFDKQGKPLLSWRVHMLPFLDQQELYRQFHLDEPWDSPHNKTLLSKMPNVYHGPNRKLNAEGKTIFLVPVGKEVAFTGGPERRRFPTDFTDGTSNTIFIVEADDAHAVPWTKPEDLKIDREHPERGLGGHFHGGSLVAMGDGSVHFLKKSISKTTLWCAFTAAGGDILGADW